MPPLRLQLQPRLDDPDWIGRCTSDDTRTCRSCKMNVGVLYAVVELVRDDLLAVTVREEVD